MANPVQDPRPGPGKREGIHLAIRILTGLGLLSFPILIVVWYYSARVAPAIDAFYEDKRQEDRLWRIAEAQERFRSDRATKAYWRIDMAGLPGLDALIAAADDRPDPTSPAGLAPLEGRFFRALAFPGEATPDPGRFAVLCHPASVKGFMYILREDGVLWRKPAGAGGVGVFPADPAAEGWEKRSR